MRKYLFFILLFSSIQYATAQVDSTDGGVDTVYIKGDPVIIKTEFYLPGSSVSDSLKWIISVGMGAGKNFDTRNGSNYKITSGNFYNYFVEAGRTYKQWTLGLGLGYLKSHGTVQYEEKQNYIRQEHATVTDTVDVYEQIVGGVTTKYYVTEQKDTVIQSPEVKDTVRRNSYNTGYFILPLRVSFTLKKNNWYFSPGLSFIPAIALHRTSLVTGDGNLSRRPFVFLAAAHAEAGRNITHKISLGAYVQCYKNISAVVKQPGQASMLLLTGGFKINFYF